MNQFRFAQFTFEMKALDILLLPAYKGSTLRGAFGHMFKKVVCALPNKDCSTCLLKEKCIYSYVFETPPASDTQVMRKYKAAPHPFIIEPPPEKKRGYKPGDGVSFGLTLIGRAIDYLPYFIYTFDELGKAGLGRGRGRYELKEVRSRTHEPAGNNNSLMYTSETKTLKAFTPQTLAFNTEISDCSNPGTELLTLSFLTPTRITYNGSLAVDLEFHVLIRQLLRRLSLLSYFHCGIDIAGWDFKGMIEAAKTINVKEKNLIWHDWERYSNRQETRMKMGGFVGDITFEGNLQPFIPLIKAGEIVHIGKGTGFGLGKFLIR